MVNDTEITEHMEVFGCDGEHVGTVDHVQGGDRIKLAKKDKASGGQHHLIPLEWVETVDEEGVHLIKSAADVMKSWEAAL